VVFVANNFLHRSGEAGHRRIDRANQVTRLVGAEFAQREGSQGQRTDDRDHEPQRRLRGKGHVGERRQKSDEGAEGDKATNEGVGMQFNGTTHEEQHHPEKKGHSGSLRMDRTAAEGPELGYEGALAVD